MLVDLWHSSLLSCPLVIFPQNGHINLSADISICCPAGRCRKPFTIFHSKHALSEFAVVDSASYFKGTSCLKLNFLFHSFLYDVDEGKNFFSQQPLYSFSCKLIFNKFSLSWTSVWGAQRPLNHTLTDVRRETSVIWDTCCVSRETNLWAAERKICEHFWKVLNGVDVQGHRDCTQMMNEMFF